jgi:hypothetical protein
MSRKQTVPKPADPVPCSALYLPSSAAEPGGGQDSEDQGITFWWNAAAARRAPPAAIKTFESQEK